MLPLVRKPQINDKVPSQHRRKDNRKASERSLLTSRSGFNHSSPGGITWESWPKRKRKLNLSWEICKKTLEICGIHRIVVFFTTKKIYYTLNSMKRLKTAWEKLFATHVTDKVWISILYGFIIEIQVTDK